MPLLRFWKWAASSAEQVGLLLVDGVGRAPEAAVVAEVHQAAGPERCIEGVLRRRELRGGAVVDVRRVAPCAAVCQAAAEDIFGADEEQSVLLRGHGGERQIVIALRKFVPPPVSMAVSAI